MFAGILLIAICIAYRIVTAVWGGGEGWLPNFAPLGAIALCGAVFLPKKWAVLLPLGAIFISDLILNAHYGFGLSEGTMLVRYTALAAIVAVGLLLRNNPRTGYVLAGSLAGSVIFYTLGNTGAWLADPGYAKTFGGWVQSMTVGLPHFPPSWVFFRNTLVSDLLFTGLFLVCMAYAARPRKAAAEAAALHTA